MSGGAGALAQLFGCNVSTIRNRRVPWSEVVGTDVAEALAASIAEAVAHADGDLNAGADVLEAWVASHALRTTATNDPLAEAILEIVARWPNASPAVIAAGVELSPRQLHRQSLRLFGYATSTLSRLLRFQRALALATVSPDRPSLARLAAIAGYSDQSHLTRDCRAITGLTPTQFLAEYVPTFPEMSDPFKTSAAFLDTMNA